MQVLKAFNCFICKYVSVLLTFTIKLCLIFWFWHVNLLFCLRNIFLTLAFVQNYFLYLKFRVCSNFGVNYVVWRYGMSSA